MTPRLSGHFYIFGLVFFVLRSLLGVGRQYGVVKNNGRILIYRTWAIGIILGRPSTSSGVRVFMDLIGSLLLEWNICPSRPDLHVAHMGTGVPRGYPRCNKKITLRVPLSKQTSFSRKAEACEVQFISSVPSRSYLFKQLEGSIWGQITPGDHLSIVQLRIFPRMSQVKQVDNKVQVNRNIDSNIL